MVASKLTRYQFLWVSSNEQIFETYSYLYEFVTPYTGMTAHKMLKKAYPMFFLSLFVLGLFLYHKEPMDIKHKIYVKGILSWTTK